MYRDEGSASGSLRSVSRPPTRKSMSRPIGASSVPPPNQRDLRLGSAQAAKTRAGGQSYVRSVVKVEWTTDRSGIGGSFEDSHMLEDGRQRHRERLRQLAHRHRPAAEPLDDRAPGRVGEGLEDEVQVRLRVK